MSSSSTLECVVNVSEGRRADLIAAIGAAAGSSLLDTHSDGHHNRSVFTLAGPEVEVDVRRLVEMAIATLDLRLHNGVHPRIGVVDVVPFVPLLNSGATMEQAMAARDQFAHWAANTLAVPCFLYGPDHNSLPEVRKWAFDTLGPDYGPRQSHHSAGAIAVGARGYLIAYNLWLRDTPLKEALRIARRMRNESTRVLALAVGNSVQISCNLIDPLATKGSNPARAYDFIAEWASIERAELVGLIPDAVLRSIPQDRWAQLDLDEEKVIEARLASKRNETGFNPGK